MRGQSRAPALHACAHHGAAPSPQVCAAKAVHLLPGAARRLTVLEQLGYLLPAVPADEAAAESAAESADEAVDEAPGSRLSLKGRVACVLTTTADSLILTEAVCDCH